MECAEMDAAHVSAQKQLCSGSAPEPAADADVSSDLFHMLSMCLDVLPGCSQFRG